MARHRSQAIAVIFIKRNAEENMLATIENLQAHLTKLPDNQLAQELVHYGSSM